MTNITRRSLHLSLAALAAASALPAAAQEARRAGGPKIKLVILDMGGTLIQDHGEVPAALSSSLSKRGIAASAGEIANWRGSSKRGMVKHFVGQSKTPVAEQAKLIDEIYADFSQQTDKAYANVQAIAGIEPALREMRAMGLLLATTTGFGRELTDAVIHHLDWKKYFVANISSDDVEDGRPAPYMLFRAMEAAHINDVRSIAAVGDTVLDIQAGDNAGAGAVIGVYSGVTAEAKLRAERASAILPSVAQLPDWLKQNA
jgi:phosphonatase-like hydrolase